MIQAIAATALAGAAFLVSWLWRPRQAMEPGVLVLLIAYALLGAWALWFGVVASPGQEPAAVHFWKPTVMYWVLAAIMIVAPPLGWGYPVKAVFGTYFVFSNREWRWINLGFAVLCTVLGTLNLVIAFQHSTDDWDGFKWSCMVNVIAVFILRVTFVWVDTIARIAKYLHGRAKAILP
jgi:intracellular septation protein A